MSTIVKKKGKEKEKVKKKRSNLDSYACVNNTTSQILHYTPCHITCISFANITHEAFIKSIK